MKQPSVTPCGRWERVPGQPHIWRSRAFPKQRRPKVTPCGNWKAVRGHRHVWQLRALS